MELLRGPLLVTLAWMVPQTLVTFMAFVALLQGHKQLYLVLALVPGSARRAGSYLYLESLAFIAQNIP